MKNLAKICDSSPVPKDLPVASLSFHFYIFVSYLVAAMICHKKRKWMLFFFSLFLLACAGKHETHCFQRRKKCAEVRDEMRCLMRSFAGNASFSRSRSTCASRYAGRD